MIKVFSREKLIKNATSTLKGEWNSKCTQYCVNTVSALVI